MPKLNPMNVVEPLRIWIPWAEIWGMTDDQGRWRHDYASDEDVQQFVEFYWKNISNNDPVVLTLEQNVENSEYTALHAMWFHCDSLLSRVQNQEINQLIGMLTKTFDGRPAPYKQLIYRGFGFDPDNQRAAIQLIADLFDGSEKAFQLYLNGLKWISIKVKETSGLPWRSGEWIVGGLWLRESREYVFPESRHFSLNTNRFRLEAEYSDVVVEKDW